MLLPTPEPAKGGRGGLRLLPCLFLLGLRFDGVPDGLAAIQQFSIRYLRRLLVDIAANSKALHEEPEEFIRDVTGTALSTNNERLRIEVLTLLSGVNWPTASVLLHFGHTEPYPILDFRALWSLGLQPPSQYNFEFWWAHTQFCRKLATRCKVSMRTLDQALWQFSKSNQP